MILNLVGQCGPLLGTNIFPESEKPLYRKGLWVSAAMCLMVAVLAVLLELWIGYEKRVMLKGENHEEQLQREEEVEKKKEELELSGLRSQSSGRSITK